MLSGYLEYSEFLDLFKFHLRVSPADLLKDILEFRIKLLHIHQEKVSYPFSLFPHSGSKLRIVFKLRTIFDAKNTPEHASSLNTVCQAHDPI